MMTNELTKTDLIQPEETPIMKQVVEDVSLYIEDYKDRERTLWQKIFPDRQQRHIELAKFKTVRDRYEFEVRALQIAHEAQLQGIQEMYNEFLIKGKAKIRKDRSEFFQQQLEDLLTTLSTRSQDFTGRLNAAYQQLEQISVDFMRQRQEQLMETIIDGYYETVAKLVKNFQCILDEEIHNSSASRGFQTPAE
jgi:hypothetical protein